MACCGSSRRAVRHFSILPLNRRDTLILKTATRKSSWICVMGGCELNIYYSDLQLICGLIFPMMPFHNGGRSKTAPTGR